MTPSPTSDTPVNLTMVTFNRVAFTRRSIPSIVNTAGYPFELTVVDNGSQDETPDLLRDLQSRGLVHRVLLNAENRGVAYAANQGWAHATRGPYMKIDNDIEFLKTNWLRDLVRVSESLPDLGAIGFNFEVQSYPIEIVNGVAVRPKVGNLGGAAIMIPQSSHERIGYWCEDYFPYGEEDLDLYIRLSLLGLRSYYMEDEDVGLHLPEGKATPLHSDGLTSAYDEGDAAYRTQKNYWRSVHRGETGLQRINEMLYREHVRSLYIEHGVPYRPSVRALWLTLRRYGRFDPWARRTIRTRNRAISSP